MTAFNQALAAGIRPAAAIAKASARALTAAQRPVGAKYATEVLAMAPTAWWRLDEASGSWKDSSGNGLDLAVTNSPGYAAPGLLASDTDKAATFDGSTTAGYGTNSSASLRPAAVTFAVWCTTVNTTGILTHGAAGNTGNFGWVLFRWSDRTTTWRIGYGAGAVQAISSIHTDDGNPHFVVGTFDGSKGTLYIDGVAVANLTAPSGLDYTGIANFRLAQQSTVDTARPWSGTLDEPAVWNRALTAAEVASLYAAATKSAGMVKAQLKVLTASETPSGVIAKLPARSLAAAIGPTAIIARGTARAMPAGITPASGMSRATSHTVSAAFVPSAVARRSSARFLAASVGSGGAVGRATSRPLSALLSQTATVLRGTSRSFIGAVSLAGSARRTRLVALAGAAVAFAAAIATRQVSSRGAVAATVRVIGRVAAALRS